MTDTPTPRIVRAWRDSDATSPFGEPRWLLYGEDTGGAFSLAFATVEPGGGPPKHVHEREDETYVVLSGSVEVTIDDRVETLGAGDCVFLPPAIPHRIHNPGPKPAQMLMLVHPPGLEHFLEAMERLRQEGPVSREAVHDLIARYNAGDLGPDS
jgi:mannose-6-phosphate isomerase-like protein (cupin superfamily)